MTHNPPKGEKRQFPELRGQLWLHDDLRNDEMNDALKAKKKHRHRYNLCKAQINLGYRGCDCYEKKYCKCGKERP